eukprot:GDKJ01024028.1.p2 GENE.GDKJ01024028.1~~GDKJ01024028.1.p2  ORF type:complete len:136 (+),score=4.86 GDKJ01024028.1:688-1095(+)
MGLVGPVPKIKDARPKVAPDVLGPEQPRWVLEDILKVVTNDIPFLEEQAHTVGYLKIIGQVLVLQAAAGKNAGQAMPHYTGNIVAIEVIVFGILDVILQEMAHAFGHLAGDIGNDFLVGGLQLLILPRNPVKLLQ